MSEVLEKKVNRRIQGDFWNKKVHPITGFFYCTYSDASAYLAQQERKKQKKLREAEKNQKK